MTFGDFKGSFQVAPLAIMTDEDLTLPQRVILAYIWSMTAYRKDKKAIITSSVLEKVTCLERNSVYINTKVLIDLGYIKKTLVKTQYSPQRCSEYSINVELLSKKYNLEIVQQEKKQTIKSKVIYINRAPILPVLDSNKNS